MSGSSVVFVHGACFSGWCWLPVIERLAQRSIVSHAVELPFDSLAGDVEYLRRHIATMKNRGKVSVVSTSYSGITASLAGHDADHLLFVAARMPQPGESQTALSASWGNPAFRDCMKFDEHGAMTLSDDADHYLFNRSPRPMAEVAMAYRRSMCSEIPSEPIDNPAWLGKPSSYVVCTDDQAVRVDRQRERAALATWSTELDADHSPFFSAPDELADFIATTHLQACT